MEPKHTSPETNAPQSERSVESNPNFPNPETSPDIQLPSVERDTRAPERAAEQSNQAQAAYAAQAAPVSLPTPVVIDDDIAVTTQADETPAIAADEDLIEKEWVDKAKQIIADTRDDPAAREKQVGKLQADYLKKRYGKELGATE
jgi:hypothetical protein